MAFLANDEKHRLNKDLYKALMEGDRDRVIEICREIPEGPLHILTIHNDTVLHMATYSKQKELVLDLLGELPNSHIENMTLQNDVGNTILHEAATSNRIVPAAEGMLRKAPKLLNMRNKRGETALFRAARYGKMEMFKFLDGEVDKIFEGEGEEDVEPVVPRAFYERDDKTTVLHISILTEHFDLALLIARKHEYLVSAQDGDGMTALQLLACNPSAFEHGSKQRCLKWLTRSCVSTEDNPMIEEGKAQMTEKESCCRVPLWETNRRKKQNYESAVSLAKFLIARDTSWEATESAIDRSKPKTHKYGAASFASQGQGAGQPGQNTPTGQTSTGGAAEIPLFLVTKSGIIDIVEETLNRYPQAKGPKAPTVQASTGETAETPLFLATKSGIIQIVEEILHRYPQAVEHIDDDGRNILHVAIKYRQIHIFDLVEKMGIPMMRLIRKIDNNGNSILHMVGIKADDFMAEDMRSPALLLREDLLLFERIKEISTTHFTKHFNNKGQTAERLFAANNAQLTTDAKEWLKRTAENCTIVAVLIATVAFAAAYTVPGGPNQETGYPILQNQPFFVFFTLTDVLSLTFALTSVITFLSILTSTFRLKDFEQSLPQKLMLGVTLLIFSVSMMMFAFAATVVLLIRSKQQWTRIALYSVAFIPVTIFAVSYLPLYMSLMKTFEYSLKKIGVVFPRCSGHFLRSWITNRFKVRKSSQTQSQATSSTGSTRPLAPQTTRYPFNNAISV